MLFSLRFACRLSCVYLDTVIHNGHMHVFYTYIALRMIYLARRIQEFDALAKKLIPNQLHHLVVRLDVYAKTPA